MHSSAFLCAKMEVSVIQYYFINEELARRAKEMSSYFDYKEGSATAEYRRSVDEAARIAEEQKRNGVIIITHKIVPPCSWSFTPCLRGVLSLLSKALALLVGIIGDSLFRVLLFLPV